MAFEFLHDNFMLGYYDLSPIATGPKDLDFYAGAAKQSVLKLGCGAVPI